MSYTKRIIYHLAGGIFKQLLITVPIAFALTLVLGNPNTIEGALKESRIYDQFVDLALDESATQNQDPKAKELLNDAEVRNSAKQAFSPQVLERTSSTVVQGFYKWLQGKTEQPEFRVDLTESKHKLIQGLSAYAEKRAANLPPCTVQQLQTLNLQDDVLSLPCLPPGVNPQQVDEQFSAQLLQDTDVLKDPVITSDALKNDKGRPFTQDISQAPAAYQGAQTAKWILLIATILLGAALVFLRRDKLAGIKHIAWALVVSSTFIIIALIGYWFFFNQLSERAAEPMQAIVFDGAQAITRELNKVLLWFAGGYLALAAALFLLVRSRQHDSTITQTPTPEPINKQEHAIPGAQEKADREADK